VATLASFYRTVPAEIARACSQPKSLPCAAEKDAPLKVGNRRLYIGVRGKVNQDCPIIGIQDATHLFGGRCKRWADQALPIAITTELTFQRHPGSSLNLRWADYPGVSDT